MKLKMLAMLIAVMLLPMLVASAAQTTIYSGTISSNERFAVSFATLRDGDITVIASFEHRGRWYKIWIHNEDKTLECQGSVDDRWGRNNADSVNCTIPNAPAGIYIAEFWASSGRTDVILSVTAETEP